MTCPPFRAFAGAAAALAAASGPGFAAPAPLGGSAAASAPVPASAASALADAPIIVIRIGVRRIVLVPRPSGSSTTISAATIENKANSTSLSAVVAASVPGVAAAPSGEIHIRGSHGQYSYYLDGAPLPTNVSGSFTDLINPKDIETLRIYTGGFPAQYGGQLAAIFDVTAKAGHAGGAGGFVQQIAQSYSDYETTAQYGGGNGRESYFVSGIRSSSNFRLSPLTQTPLHDDGLENVGFGKFDYQSGPSDRITLDTASTGATIQVPNNQLRQSLGQNDVQKENGRFANLIWRHLSGADTLRVALYSHTSQLRYFGDPAHDLLPDPGLDNAADQSTTTENQKASYVGLRTDYTVQAGRAHKIGLGLDANTVSGRQFFNSTGPGQDPLLDSRHLSGGDKSAYVQDDWTTGRTLIDYGVRYDVHQADVTTSQLSPRLNLTYTAGQNKFHAYYDRLFQPIAVEDVIQIGKQGEVTTFQPERDDFFETGYTRQLGGATLSLDGYYRAEKNTIDDQPYGNTQIAIPFNLAKGYTRGLEIALDGPITRTVSYYANYARAWAKAAGPIIGGLLGAAPSSYFYDDHDQTHSASFGLAYGSHGTFGTLDGEYGSGFPFGEIDNAQGSPATLNYLRVPVHTILNASVGAQVGHNQIALQVGNLLNHGFVIKQAGPFTDTEWGQGRTYGVKWTQNF